MYRLYDGREKDFEIITTDLEKIKNYLGELYSDCKDIDELTEELEKNNDGMDFYHIEKIIDTL